MDSREELIRAATALIEERGEDVNALTVREICKRAGVGLGLVNYHFGSKEALVAICVERIVAGIVQKFTSIREQTTGFTPFEKLEFLGSLTFDFLFGHAAVSRISILTDMQTPKADDNTQRTFSAFLPLVAACRPDWEEDRVRRVTYCLITSMQQAFLRQDAVLRTQGADLRDRDRRRAFHRQMLQDLLGVNG